MKVVSAAEMARIEQLAYADGASEEDFMEAAGRGIADAVVGFVTDRDEVHHATLFCGRGNNGGDAYVAGRYLRRRGFNVKAFQLSSTEDLSPLSAKNAASFKEEGGRIHCVESMADLPLPTQGILLDGILGTGFQGDIQGLFSEVITAINQSPLPCISIDIPSGLNGNTGEVTGPVVEAAMTVFLGMAKTGFFICDGWNYVGDLFYVDFGLEQTYVDQAQEDLNLLLPQDIKQRQPKMVRTRHKYEAGYVVALAGSPGMSGAAILSASGALRGGAGIVKLLHPEGMEGELANSPVELIKIAYTTRDLDRLRETMMEASACLAGPGLARSPGMKVVVNTILPLLHMPCVIDADGINIMAEEGLKPPRKTVLTPHMAEMGRLLGMEAKPVKDLAFLGQCQNFAEGNDITLVLKGGPSFILYPGKKPSVCPRGDPGMATAGSGDVLTGIITALLSQGLSTEDAALVGVYSHAVSGELAAGDLTSFCMTASDLLHYLPEAYQELFA